MLFGPSGYSIYGLLVPLYIIIRFFGWQYSTKVIGDQVSLLVVVHVDDMITGAKCFSTMNMQNILS